MAEGDFAADYFALRAANDSLRERGKTWLWDQLSQLCVEANQRLAPASLQGELQLGRQPWEFTVGRAVMIGERFGVRYRGKTLIVEIGWPRESAHGFVADQGLARGRISLSLSPILSAQPGEELILKKDGDQNLVWYSIRDGKTGEQLTSSALQGHLSRMMRD